jgi:hypothetical protein
MSIPRTGLAVPDNTAFIELGVSGFKGEDRPFREVVLNKINAVEDVSGIIVVDIPYKAYVQSAPGVGFHLAVREALNKKFKHVSSLQVDCQYWGCPLEYKRLFVVGSSTEIFPLPKQPLATVSAWDETILFHSVSGIPLAKVTPGLLSVTNGVIQSHLGPFGGPEQYAQNKPIVARRDGNSYAAGSLMPKEWRNLYGVEESAVPPNWEALTPTSVVNAVLKHLSTVVLQSIA